MSLDELYVNIEELKIDKYKPHGREGTGSCPDRAEAVAGSETTHFRVAIVCLGVLCFTLLIAAIGIGAQYTTVYNQLMGYNQNLTEERDQINSSYYSVLSELNKAKKNMMSCPDGWKRFSCRCYYLSPTSNIWEGSRQQCQSMGADLVIINSQQEMTFLNTFGAKFWIGLSRPTGAWQWIDGRSLTTSYWQDGNPQYFNYYYSYSYSNCAAFNTFYSPSMFAIKSWSSELCTDYQQWVCEKEATPSTVK